MREKLADDKRLLQTFIMAKMKCFDYFSVTSPSLFSIFSELVNHNLLEIAQHLLEEFDKVRDNTEQTLFDLFNQKNIDIEDIIVRKTLMN
ncbi:MAG TPA: hypothetical protein ACHBX0_10895 [Arsenophonus sp.]